MFRELRDIWNDIRGARWLDAYAVFFGSLVVILADLIWELNEKGFRSFILACLAYLVYESIQSKREAYINRESFEDLAGFRATRQNMPKLDALFEKATKEIILCSLKQLSLVHLHLDALAKAAKRGCKVTLLLLRPREEGGEINPNVLIVDEQRMDHEILRQLETNVDILLHWHEKLAPETRERVSIRVFRNNPGLNIFVLDPDEAEAWMQVEVTLPYVPVFSQPSYIIKKRDGPSLFGVHMEMIRALWDRSTDLKGLKPVAATAVASKKD